MTHNYKRKRQAKLLRIFRKIHRTTGAVLFIFFFFISVSGLFLGWKKHSLGIILPISLEGTSTNLKDWLPLDSLQTNAQQFLQDSIQHNSLFSIDRVDVRKEKGMVKFIFEEDFWEVQLDGATGSLLHIGKRHSDLIENIHDGSFLDDYFYTTNNPIKLFYTTIVALALLSFTITGFWLWYGPKRMRQRT